MPRGLATLNLVRRFSSKTEFPRTVVVCSNGAVASWHPASKFPYEHTKPIDLKVNETTQTHKSVLSPDIKNLKQSTYVPKHVDLKEIFYTDKNEWYTRTREKKLYNVSSPLPKRR